MPASMGLAAAARHSRKLEKQVSESTVKAIIKKCYVEQLQKRPRTHDQEGLAAFPAKKRGRKVLLGEDLDHKVQVYT